MPSSPSAPKRSAAQRGARVLVLGVGLGVTSFIVATLLGYELAARLQVWRWQPSLGSWLFQRVLLGQLGALVVAPLLAYLAGRAFPGLPWTVAAASLVCLQAAAALWRLVFFGPEAFADAAELTALLACTAAGLGLSVWAIRLAARAGVRATAAGRPLALSAGLGEAPGSVGPGASAAAPIGSAGAASPSTPSTSSTPSTPSTAPSEPVAPDGEGAPPKAPGPGTPPGA